MDRDRQILLKILLAALAVPVFLFGALLLSEVREKRDLILRLKEANTALSAVQGELSTLEKEKARLTAAAEAQGFRLFSSEKITYYQFCDFIVDSAENRGLSLKDYTTDEGTSPQRILLSAEGRIGEITAFLHHLYTGEKRVDIPRMVISFNAPRGMYNLSLTANFITHDYSQGDNL